MCWRFVNLGSWPVRPCESTKWPVRPWTADCVLSLAEINGWAFDVALQPARQLLPSSFDFDNAPVSFEASLVDGWLLSAIGWASGTKTATTENGLRWKEARTTPNRIISSFHFSRVKTFVKMSATCWVWTCVTEMFQSPNTSPSSDDANVNLDALDYHLYHSFIVLNSGHRARLLNSLALSACVVWEVWDLT